MCYGGTYREPNHAVIQLYGHVHSNQNNENKDTSRLDMTFPYQYDVGVDNNNYYPISWNQILDIINSKIENNG